MHAFDRQMDGQNYVCIPCSAVKIEAKYLSPYFKFKFSLGTKAYIFGVGPPSKLEDSNIFLAIFFCGGIFLAIFFVGEGNIFFLTNIWGGRRNIPDAHQVCFKFPIYCFMLKSITFAHSSMLSNSRVRLSILIAGTVRYRRRTWPANFLL